MKPKIAAIILAGCLAPSMAHAVPIAGTGDLGSFTGTFVYDGTLATLSISLTNTSPNYGGGFITGFVFNLPGGATSATLVPDPTESFGQLLPDTLTCNDDDVKASPHGCFDVGVSTGGSFEGGNTSGGIAFGQTVAFTFTLGGTGLGGLDEEAFFSELSVAQGNGNGNFEGEAFVVRFQGYEVTLGQEDSDKVPGAIVPEPGSMLLVGSGLAALLVRRRRRA